MKLPFNDDQWRWVAQKYREGHEVVKLAKFLGVHRETVRRHLQEMGEMPYAKDELDPLSKDEFNSLGDVK